MNMSSLAGPQITVSGSGEMQTSIRRKRRDDHLYKLEDLREADDLDEEDSDSGKLKENVDSLLYSDGTGTMGANTTFNFAFTATNKKIMMTEDVRED